MHPEIAKIGPFTLYAWGLMVALAFLIGILLASQRATKVGFPKEMMLDLGFYVLISSLVGARLAYVIQFWDQFRGNLTEIWMVHHGGLVFLGGLMGGLFTIFFYTWRKKIPLLRILDIATPPLLLGYAIGRIGCFLNGCCYGQPTHFSLGMIFQPGSEAYLHFGATPLHPTQLYASITALNLFLITLWLEPRLKREGLLFAWGILLYGSYRFLIEMLRANPTYWLGLSLSQYGALLLILLAGYLFFLHRPLSK